MTRALDVANDLSTFQSKYNNGVLDSVTLTNSIIDTTTTTNGTFTLSGNLKIPENYGIDFNNYGSEDSNSATTVGSNLLDDYEEGTWTPVWQDNTNTYSGAYSAQEGSYTRIGRMVFFQGNVRASDDLITVGGLSGGDQIRLGNLPFISNSNFQHAASINIIRTISADGSATQNTAFVSTGTTYLRFRYLTFGSANTNNVLVNQLNAGNREVIVSGFYHI